MNRNRLPRTLTEFFRSTGASIRTYDLGRRVSRIAGSEFMRFEETTQPYPFPLRRNAWVGLLFWTGEHTGDPLIWCMKLPLDEQGRLVQASRDYFLRRLYEAFGEHHSSQSGREAQSKSVLDDNPFTFRPAEARMAMFRAKSCVDLGLPASGYYEHAKAYFAGQLGFEGWSELGIQGVADVAARLSEGDNAEQVASQLMALPPEPFIALCTAMESARVGAKLAKAISARAQLALEHDAAPAIVAGAIRGLGWTRATRVRAGLVDAVLDSEQGSDIEVLASIAGRAWEVMDDSERRHRFVERLAASDAGQPGFDAVISDLLFMPGLRAPMLATLRDTGRSALLTERIGALFAAVHKAASR